MSGQAKIQLPELEHESAIITGSEDEKAFDITKLRSNTGHITLDPGYGNTGACISDITFIDGEKGILRYRGYPIEQLAEQCKFTEICYLLLYGDLPTEEEQQKFSSRIKQEQNIHEDMKRFFDGFPITAHPMAILSAMITSLSAYHESTDISDKEKIDTDIIRLLGRVKSFAAFSYRKSHGLPYIYPQQDLSYVENFLHMMFSDTQENYKTDPVLAEALNLLLILHADHEQNCSTSTVRMVGSSQANLYTTISAGIGALWGPLHGGANQRVIEMLEEIRDDGSDYKKYVDMAKDKNSDYKLFGFGHRVYKNYDPRAKVLSQVADRVLKALNVDDPLMEIAKNLEEVALNDEYFIARKLYPNVDFYSGIIYKAMGIPTNMFTVMFALGRLPGWLAHWREMILDPKSRINRPRQVYTGPTLRDVTQMKDR